MNREIAGDNSAMLDADIATFEIRDQSTCFTNEQAARRNIPGRESLFPKPIKPSSRHVGEVNRRGARPANPTGSGSDSRELPLVLLQTG